MNNFNIKNFELNEARKRMNTVNPASNMTNMTSSVNYSMNQNSYSNLPNLYNSNSVDSSEIDNAKQKMNNYSSMYTSNNNSMY